MFNHNHDIHTTSETIAKRLERHLIEVKRVEILAYSDQQHGCVVG